MTCLRAVGTLFDVDAFIAVSSLPPGKVFRKGEFVSKRRRREVYDAFAIVIHFSDADWDELDVQFRDALRFMTDYEQELKQLVNFPNVEDVYFDFMHRLVLPEDAVRFPLDFTPDLLLAAGQLGIGIRVSIYRVAD